MTVLAWLTAGNAMAERLLLWLVPGRGARRDSIRRHTMNTAAFFKATAIVLALIAAAASGAEAAHYWAWSSGARYSDSDGEGLLRALPYIIGIPLALLLAIKAIEIGQDILSFFWSFFHRK